MRSYVCALLLILFASGCLSTEKEKYPSQEEKADDLPVFTTGQWSDYIIMKFSKESNINSPQNLSEATIRISLVGEKVIQNTRFYWIEYLINKGKEQQRIVKMLIDKNGALQPIRLVIKNGRFSPVEFDLRRWETRTRLTKEIILQEITGGFNIIPFVTPDHSEKFETEKLFVKLEEKNSSINCRKIILDNNPAGTIWYNEKIPFAGLVKAEFINGNDKNVILLTAYGTGSAKSLINEKPKELDFQE